MPRLETVFMDFIEYRTSSIFLSTQFIGRILLTNLHFYPIM